MSNQNENDPNYALTCLIDHIRNKAFDSQGLGPTKAEAEQIAAELIWWEVFRSTPEQLANHLETLRGGKPQNKDKVVFFPRSLPPVS